MPVGKMGPYPPLSPNVRAFRASLFCGALCVSQCTISTLTKNQFDYNMLLTKNEILCGKLFDFWKKITPLGFKQDSNNSGISIRLHSLRIQIRSHSPGHGSSKTTYERALRAVKSNLCQSST